MKLDCIVLYLHKVAELTLASSTLTCDFLYLVC